MRLAAAVMLVGAAVALGGCGESPREQVQAKVEQLASAAASKDYKTICTQVLAPSLIRHLSANAIGCEEAMRVALAGVNRPVVSIGKITIAGRRASAITLTVAQGQRASLAAIELIKTGDGWRISSLGSPLSAAPGR